MFCNHFGCHMHISEDQRCVGQQEGGECSVKSERSGTLFAIFHKGLSTFFYNKLCHAKSKIGLSHGRGLLENAANRHAKPFPEGAMSQGFFQASCLAKASAIYRIEKPRNPENRSKSPTLFARSVSVNKDKRSTTRCARAP